jgi:phosphoribosylaminoimidazole (AIR) synthetase
MHEFIALGLSLWVFCLAVGVATVSDIIAMETKATLNGLVILFSNALVDNGWSVVRFVQFLAFPSRHRDGRRDWGARLLPSLS